MDTEFTGTSTGGCDVPERRAQPDESPPGRLEPLSMNVSSEWSRERRTKPRLLPGLLPLLCPPPPTGGTPTGSWTNSSTCGNAVWMPQYGKGAGKEKQNKTAISDIRGEEGKVKSTKKKESVTTSSVHSQCLSVVRAMRVRRASSRLKPRPLAGAESGSCRPDNHHHCYDVSDEHTHINER